MRYIKSILFALAVFLPFSATSFAGSSISTLEIFTFTWEASEANVNTRDGAALQMYLARIDPVSGEVMTIGATDFGHCTGSILTPMAIFTLHVND